MDEDNNATNGLKRRRTEDDRISRETSISRHSEAYGNSWCYANAENVVSYIRKWRSDKEENEELCVRVYVKTEKALKEIPLSNVLNAIQLGDDNKPVRLRSSQYGQVHISDSIALSSGIYNLIVCVWNI